MYAENEKALGEILNGMDRIRDGFCDLRIKRAKTKVMRRRRRYACNKMITKLGNNKVQKFTPPQI